METIPSSRESVIKSNNNLYHIEEKMFTIKDEYGKVLVEGDFNENI